MNFFDSAVFKKIVSSWLNAQAKKKLGYDPKVTIDALSLNWTGESTLSVSLTAKADIDASSIVALIRKKEA